MQARPRILLVENTDPSIKAKLKQASQGSRISTCKTRKKALAGLLDHDLVIIHSTKENEDDPEDFDFLEFLRVGRAISRFSNIIIYTELNDIEDEREALKLGAADYVRSKQGIEILIERIIKCLHRSICFLKVPKIESSNLLKVLESLKRGKHNCIALVVICGIEDYINRFSPEAATKVIQKAWGVISRAIRPLRNISATYLGHDGFLITAADQNVLAEACQKIGQRFDKNRKRSHPSGHEESKNPSKAYLMLTISILYSILPDDIQEIVWILGKTTNAMLTKQRETIPDAIKSRTVVLVAGNHSESYWHREIVETVDRRFPPPRHKFFFVFPVENPDDAKDVIKQIIAGISEEHAIEFETLGIDSNSIYIIFILQTRSELWTKSWRVGRNIRYELEERGLGRKPSTMAVFWGRNIGETEKPNWQIIAECAGRGRTKKQQASLHQLDL